MPDWTRNCVSCRLPGELDNFKIAKDIDKEYYENYLLAKKAGVIFLAYQCKISSKEIKIDKKIKIINA